MAIEKRAKGLRIFATLDAADHARIKAIADAEGATISDATKALVLRGAAAYERAARRNG